MSRLYPQQMIRWLGGKCSSNRSVYKIHGYCEIREANNNTDIVPFTAKIHL
ncbi:hypothetical protein CC99x_007605 [Candidatus Berkiella cookevillensis]|uniref:Uncharacterized protein n=1 Tax=Candidatus Berkiella cookevillensis TaxID=437022 RepID=A0AAE3L4V8_9GAMM|nr:hypothetical protein [Candidatus Berkiella cookevillensis]MCS5708768.1 hypothetical protein [Candidatus Berkiella cookevillensis]